MRVFRGYATNYKVSSFDFINLFLKLQSIVTYQVVESSAHSFGVDPQLPFTRVTVPRLTNVIPFEQFFRVVDPVDGVPVDG